MPTLLLTGANRGLGLEFARQYHQDGWRVLATCRDPESAKALQTLADASGGQVTIRRLDLDSPRQIAELARELAEVELDLLLNNGGVYPERSGLGQIAFEEWEQAFRINSIAPIRMAEAFLPALEPARHPVIANVTSKMGSIADNSSGGSYGYRASKAALNIATVSLAHDLASRGITALLLHPGWVATAMGGASAPLSVEESVRGMRRVIAAAGPAESGRFFAYDGSEIPW